MLTCGPLDPLWARLTLRSCGASDPLWTLYPWEPLSPLWPLWPCHALSALISGRALEALRASRADRATRPLDDVRDAVTVKINRARCIIKSVTRDHHLNPVRVPVSVEVSVKVKLSWGALWPTWALWAGELIPVLRDHLIHDRGLEHLVRGEGRRDVLR